jgi:N5-(carboxyethyl)ornithine synthase
MQLGIVGTSLKENERRVPVFPEHLPRYPESLRKKMVFETGFGQDYGYGDEYFAGLGSAVASRDALLTECDIVVLPKPLPGDLAKMKAGQVLFGWPHAVQQRDITQLAIDRRITVIAWEAMHHWSPAGEKLVHVFYKNNEIAGYAAVLHCLQLVGIDGHYGPTRKVIVLSYGSVSRGAIYALQGRGFKDIRVYTQRPPYLVADQNPDVRHGQYYYSDGGELMARNSDGKEFLLIEELGYGDIICNGILQDTNKPIVFVKENEVGKLKPRSVIIDISCDEGMGFSFARPTTFKDPIFQVGDKITYYSVDHTPSYLWSAASREISNALLSYMGIIEAGERAWDAEPTIARAIEILHGVIQNRNILNFQRRKKEYPHEIEES